MLEIWGINVSSDAFSMLLDGLLLLVMVALWWLWWQQAKQRKDVELKLGEAAVQLQEATKMLDEALQQIERLQEHESHHEVGPQGEIDDNVKVSFSDKSIAMSDRYAKNKKTHTPSKKRVAKQPVESMSPSSQSAQILRMQREGVSPENIAVEMNIPLAQVKLMLMLQKAQ